MSRIGKIPITVPKGVDVQVTPDHQVKVKGPKGELVVDTRGNVAVTIEGGVIHVARPDDSKESRAYHGLYHRLITNMLKGVSVGFARQLEIQGVGYRVAKEGTALNFQLGYSHPIRFDAPAGITFEVKDTTNLSVSGCDKCLVGQVAADIRRLRPPEPYKGKGIRYLGEQVRRKAGKTGGK